MAQNNSNVSNGTLQYEADKTHQAAIKLITPLTQDEGLYYINGNNVTGNTFKGTANENGAVSYSTTAITSLSSAAVTEDTVLYFRTEITDNSGYETNTSVFVDLEYSAALEDNYFIGVSEPTKELMTYNSGSTAATRTIRWVPVVNKFLVLGNGTSYVEWYVKFTASGNFKISNIVVTCN